MAPAAKRRKANAEVERFMCYGCDEPRTSKQFPDYNPSSDCEHLINICTKCLKQWIEVQVDNGNFTFGGKDGKALGIKCPQCPAVMKNVNVYIATTKKVYNRFEEVERKHISESTPGWFWCLAPHCRAGHVVKSSINVIKMNKRGCGKSIVGKSKKDEAGKDVEVGVFNCKKCGAKACVPCARPYHEGESCAEYQLRIKDRLEEEDKALKEIKRVTKPCPKCKKNIQKNGGCTSMTCYVCQVNFCWNCLGEFKKGYCKCYPPPSTN